MSFINNYLYLFVIFFLLIDFVLSYNNTAIIIPFRYPNEQSLNFNDTILNNKMYTENEIGFPPQTININIALEEYGFLIGKNLCKKESISNYDYKQSQTFINQSKFMYSYNGLRNACYISEQFSFYNNSNLNNNITIPDLECFYGITHKTLNLSKYQPENYCGVLGLSQKPKYEEYDLYTFLQIIKKIHLVKDYSYYFDHFIKDINKDNNKLFIKNYPQILNDNIINNYAGLLVYGNYSLLSTSKYKFKYFLSARAEARYNQYDNGILFNIIYFNLTNAKDNNTIAIMKYKIGNLNLYYNYIICPNEYFIKIITYYFQFYIDKNLCFKDNIIVNEQKLEIIICDKHKFSINEIKKFPPVKFYSKEYNTTFILTYNDVFKEINEKIYFLILNKVSQDYWQLGKIFMMKYQFSFEPDKRMLTYYFNENNEIQSKNIANEFLKKNISSFIWIFICCLMLFGGLLLGKKIWDKTRKKRANELQEDFEYFSENNKNNNIRKTEQNIEMGNKLGIYN